MSDDEEATYTFKAVINKQKNKVLFVEIENDLANVLLGLMTLPLGRIVQLLVKHYGENTPVIGSLNTLYNGVSNLDCSHFKSYDEKLMLLNPKSACLSPFRNMKLSFYGSEPANSNLVKAFTGNFVEFPASFIVSDDLRMMDSVNRSFVESLDYLGLAMADLDGAETRNVTFGVDEIMDLLKALFISHHPLTDIVLGTKQTNFPESGMEHPYLFSGVSSPYHLIENDTTSDPKSNEMILKLVFEKSSKRFLFAQAGQDFVDLLFSMLVVPLGVVLSLSQSGATGLNNIDNLHASIPKMGRGVFSANIEDSLSGKITPYDVQSFFASQAVQTPIFVDFRSRMYIVSDDLNVTPFSVCSTLSLLNQMKISPSDVKEVELVLDPKEVQDSSFLETSLTSTRTMTDGLISILLRRRLRKKNPKH